MPANAVRALLHGKKRGSLEEIDDRILILRKHRRPVNGQRQWLECGADLRPLRGAGAHEALQRLGEAEGKYDVFGSGTRGPVPPAMRVQEYICKSERVCRCGLQGFFEPLIENDPVFVDWNGQEMAHGFLS